MPGMRTASAASRTAAATALPAPARANVDSARCPRCSLAGCAMRLLRGYQSIHANPGDRPRCVAERAEVDELVRVRIRPFTFDRKRRQRGWCRLDAAVPVLASDEQQLDTAAPQVGQPRVEIQLRAIPL